MLSPSHKKKTFNFSLNIVCSVFQNAKMASLQWVGTLRERAASFPLFTKEQFTGNAHLKTRSRNGVQLLKCLN